MIFGNKGQLQEQVDASLERIGQLEQQVERLASLVERQQKDIEKLHGRLDELRSALSRTGESLALQSGEADARTHMEGSDGVKESGSSREQTLYFGPPQADGLMSEPSVTVREGDSIYQLDTPDGSHGVFSVIPTPDSLATALISVSQFVKPVCRVVGTVSAQASRLETLHEGTAEFHDGSWVVTRKAEVKFV